MEKDSHITILRAFDELPFSIGKKTLLDFLKGNPNATIDKNNLAELNTFGTLFKLDKSEILDLIQSLIEQKYITHSSVPGGFQVLKRTTKGTKELYEKKFVFSKKEKEYNLGSKLVEDEVTQEDRKLFSHFDFFLSKYNEEQKKAIISEKKNILCVAGAGSGKTTVLTKRCEFLVKFKSVDPKKILAITFTRKARDEMKERLEALDVGSIKIETFNSFCERLLKKHGDLVYDKEVRVASFSDKITLVNESMREAGVHFEDMLEYYFTKKQRRERRREDLFFIFVNDMFSILDFYKNSLDSPEEFYKREKNPVRKRIAKSCHKIALKLEMKLKERGLRDFSDQIVDTLTLLKENNEVALFDHVLVDEFQDINCAQMQLLKLLNPPNLFAVGDPRQAIYGWRGSEIKYIMDFPKEFENTQVIMLKTNYRSSQELVSLFNESITPLGLPDLKSSCEKNGDKHIFLMQHDTEQLEQLFVLEAIKNSPNNRQNIFVLARTNKVLEKYAELFAKSGVKYAIKSEEEYINSDAKEDEVTLATVHSIKGMEAKEVYVVSANTVSFPNKVQDNFVFALLKQYTNYDKESEELRLFYVALSRAMEKLVICYTGNPTKFLTSKMLDMLEHKQKNKSLFSYGNSSLDSSDNTVLKNMLKNWRSEKSAETGLPHYMILNNAVIEELSRWRPQSKHEMVNIKGMGNLKVAKYGDELLRIING